MAARSSSKSSLDQEPIVLRITYDELLALADELDKEKKKKHSKRNSHKKGEKTSQKQLKHGGDEKEIEESADNVVSTNDRGSARRSREGSEKKEKKQDGKKHKKGSSKSKEQRKDESVDSNSKIEKKVSTDKHKPVDKHKGEAKEPEEYDLELRAHTGGVSKLSKGKRVSFRESDNEIDTEHNLSTPHTDSDPKRRGIIKIPVGFDVRNDVPDAEKRDPSGDGGIDSGLRNSTEHPRKSTRGESYEKGDIYGRLYEPDRPERNPSEGARVRSCSENQDSRTPAEKGHLFSGHNAKRRASLDDNALHETCTKDNRTQSMLSGMSDVPCPGMTEKRRRAVNRERVQQLMKLATQSEASLSNLLSRDVLDKKDFQKVKSLSREIQNHYKGILMLDLGFSAQHDIDQLLWRSAFYQVIETFRKYGKLFLGYSEKKELLSQEQINKELLEFLEESRVFYSGLLDALQSNNQFRIQDLVSQPRRAEELAKNVSNKM